MNQDLIEIMTVEETAEFLRVPVSSVYKMAQLGKIPAQKVGRHWRFYRPALVNWVAHNTLPLPTQPASQPEVPPTP